MSETIRYKGEEWEVVHDHIQGVCVGEKAETTSLTLRCVPKKKFDPSNLEPGLYTVYTSNGSYGPCAVGKTMPEGQRWFHSINSFCREATTNWSNVERVELIEKA